MRSILRFFKNLFSKKSIDAIEHALQVAAPYVAMAMPIVEEIAKLTPTRSDDEILAVLKTFGLHEGFYREADRGGLLRDIATEVVSRNVKDPVKTSVLNLAVELAYNATRKTVTP
jgi:hypothetical protein